MIHKTDIYKKEYEKYLFFRKIWVFVLVFLAVLIGGLCFKVFTHGGTVEDVTIGDFKYDLDTTAKTAMVTGYTGSDEDLEIPETIQHESTTYNVTSIGKKAFYENQNIKKVTGNSIERLESYSNCGPFEKSSLTEISLPKATYIYSAFHDCSKLTSISLPEATYIGSFAFYDCDALTSISLPEATYIGKWAFEYCNQLTDIFLPEATYIGPSAFGNCQKLQKVYAPKLVYFVRQGSSGSIFNSINSNITFETNVAMKNLEIEACAAKITDYTITIEYIDTPPEIAGTILVDTIPEGEPSGLSNKINEIKNKLSQEHNNIGIGYEIIGDAQKIYEDRNSKYFIVRFYPTDYRIGAANGFTDVYLRIMVTDVKAEWNIADGTVFEYDGQEHKPALNMKDGDYTLVEGTDYQITGDFINAGEQTATLEFMGTYKGMNSITKTFTVIPKNASDFDIEYEKVHIYDGKLPEFKIKDGGKDLVLNQDYTIEFDGDIKEIGTKNVKIKYIGNYTGESRDIELEVVADKSNWGEAVNNNGIINYVDTKGKTSAEVTGNSIIWLKEFSDDTGAWYAIDNSKGTFRQGSRFWIKWLSAEKDKEEFEKYYEQLDEYHKNKVEKNKLWIFLAGVTDPDGNNYTNLLESIDFYIQLGDDWDKNDINAVFISGNNDETLEVYYKNIQSPESLGEFSKIVMKHFSPYAIYDNFEQISEDDNPENNEIKIETAAENEPKNNTIDSAKEKTRFPYSINSGLIIKSSMLVSLFIISTALLGLNLKSKSKNKRKHY